jgi:hypothetical protein
MMANWCNLRLIVTGRADDLKPFRRAAGALRGRIKAKRSEIFTDEMDTFLNASPGWPSCSSSAIRTATFTAAIVW